MKSFAEGLPLARANDIIEKNMTLHDLCVHEGGYEHV